MMHSVKILLIILIAVFGCSKQSSTRKYNPDIDYTKYVNPFIGTGADGHTFPGALVPFGMVQLSPDTRLSGGDYASGYHYSDSVILGFSHTRYSGTGRGAGGDFMFMPFTGGVDISVKDAAKNYRSPFSHKDEKASPGYYRVLLKKYGITAELTATKRVGVHKYSFPESEGNGIIFDLTHGISDRPDSLFLKIIDDRTIAGMRKSLGGLREFQTLYFIAEFSEPFSGYEINENGMLKTKGKEFAGKDIKAKFKFDDEDEVEVNVAISKVGIDGAKKNLSEVADLDFDDVKEMAKNAWNRVLGRIDIQTNNTSLDTIFYTAFYHSCIMPSLDTDIDGRYRSTNNKIYKADGFTSYTNFSLWDTFRALHPLMTIIDQSRTRDFINTFIERYEHSGSMPIFELSGNDLLVMIGYHSLPVIADAYAKGIRGFDVQKAIEGMKGLADMPFEERNEYKTFGYIPYELTDQAVSRSLEFAFDDWCLAEVAKGNDDAAYRFYSHRGNFFRNLFDKKSRFMRPKDINGKWMKDFAPTAYTRKYTQGNAWQYTTFVPQNIPCLVDLIGGDRKFEMWLDKFFTVKNKKTYNGRVSELLIGQYYHGNEPSHHVAYLYNYAGVPWKTQQMVRKIMDSQYLTTPQGLAGNDDAGQMSAWYVLSSLGFYSVTPGMDYYVIGSPKFDEATINLEDGKTFKIVSVNNAPENVYIQSVTLNGKQYNKSYIKHSDIMKGGIIVFEMGSKPNKEWGHKKADRPYVNEFNDVAVPKISVYKNTIGRDGVVTFNRTSSVTVSCATQDAEMFYTTDGAEPDKNSKRVEGNIDINKSSVLKVKAFKEGLIPSYTSTVKFRKMEPQPAIKVVDPQKGIKYEYREVWICKKTDQIDQYPILKTGIVSKASSETGFKMALNHGLIFSGYIYIPVTGTYTFYINTEYAASLRIDGELIASNESTDWLGERSGKIALQKGYHKILVKNYQIGEDVGFKLLWKGPGIDKEEIPGLVYFH